MRLKLYKTLWGHTGTIVEASAAAQDAGFDGVEAVPPAIEQQADWGRRLDDANLDFIAEIPTTGDYVPRREAPVAEHLESLREGLIAAKALRAKLVNCVGGCDAWSLPQSVDFFGVAITLAKQFEIPIAFETHRARSTFTPWATRDILHQLPEMQLTCDFSHWCVVLERLPDSEPEIMTLCFERALHIHARVGYAQGPQVTDPGAPEFRPELEAHEMWWTNIWRSREARGADVATMTPEFGPDGYLHCLPHTGMPVADLTQINAWMARRQRQRFENYRQETFHS
ncbi:MAG TPA: TIM barrel protein [Abditibacteriaceae bacterium]